MFLKNRNIIFKMKISKVTDYAALISVYMILLSQHKGFDEENVMKVVIICATIKFELLPSV